LVPVDAHDTEVLREQIKWVWNKIQERDYYTGCGKKECHWCNFVKTNKLGKEISTEEQEETEV
jgi:DNA helicase-2/ATP-dependent DNA helicase PcrA